MRKEARARCCRADARYTRTRRAIHDRDAIRELRYRGAKIDAADGARQKCQTTPRGAIFTVAARRCADTDAAKIPHSAACKRAQPKFRRQNKPYRVFWPQSAARTPAARLDSSNKMSAPPRFPRQPPPHSTAAVTVSAARCRRRVPPAAAAVFADMSAAAARLPCRAVECRRVAATLCRCSPDFLPLRSA